MPLTTRENHLCDLISRRHDSLLDDLRLHVNTPTGPGSDGVDETRGRFRERLTALGAQYDEVPGDPKPDWLYGVEAGGPIPLTAICRRTGSKPGPRILIAGHLDTVHSATSEFRELTIAGDKATAIGPGCVDMKGGLVIAVAALEALEEAGIPCAWTFAMNADEETGTYHSESALRGEAGRHDIGLAFEPALADGSLAIERMGSGQFVIETLGRSAHVGREFEKGVSAVLALAGAILESGEFADPVGGRVLSIGPIEGGGVTNAVPDRARAWGNVRFSTPEAADELAAMLDALSTPENSMPRTIVRRSFNRPPKPMIPETERLALAARDAAQALGQKLPFAKTGGVCDGNILQDAGVPTIDTLGVRGGGLHTPEEWIDLASLVERCQLLALLISRLTERWGANSPS